MANQDVAISVVRPRDPMLYWYRYAHGDEAIFVHEGTGTLESQFGSLRYGPGDYLVIPTGVMWRILPDEGTSQRMLVVVGTRPRSEVRAQAWVRGPVWDTVWMLSALWLAPLVLLLSFGSDDPRTGSLNVLYFGFSALLWTGHRVASTWLAYFTTAYRPLLRTQPLRFLLVPAAIAVCCFAILLPDDEALDAEDDDEASPDDTIVEDEAA